MGRAKLASGRWSGGYLCTCRNLIWVSSLFEPTTFFEFRASGGWAFAKFALDGLAGRPRLGLDTSLVEAAHCRDANGHFFVSMGTHIFEPNLIFLGTGKWIFSHLNWYRVGYMNHRLGLSYRHLSSRKTIYSGSLIIWIIWSRKNSQ